MLPAICFVFSRKHVEKAAKEINTSLFEKDNNSHALISKECRHIISSKIVNYKEYLELFNKDYKDFTRALFGDFSLSVNVDTDSSTKDRYGSSYDCYCNGSR